MGVPGAAGGKSEVRPAPCPACPVANRRSATDPTTSAISQGSFLAQQHPNRYDRQLKWPDTARKEFRALIHSE